MTLSPRIAFAGKAPEPDELDASARRRPRRLLHRQFAADPASPSPESPPTRRRSSILCAISPLPTPTARRCSRASASPASTNSSPTSPPTSASTTCSTCRGRRARSRWSACSARWPAKNVAAGSVPFFVGAGAYRHHVPASVDHLIQRSEFLTSYTPYQPEISQGTLQVLFEFQTQVAQLTRHGGRQRLHVRRLDRHRRGGADGAAGHPARARRCCPAACIRITARWSRTYSRFSSDGVVELPPDPTGSGGDPRRHRRRDLLRRRPVAVLLRPAHRPEADRREGARQGRAAGRGRHRGGSPSARSSRRARWAPTSSSARASRSAIRSPSAAPMSACSPPARNTSARCPGGSAARPSTPTAGAASC